MANFYASYPAAAGGGGGSGVTSLNSLTGVLALVAGSGISITPSGSNITIANIGSGGTVTSVGLVDSTGLFNISGSPVTTAGSLTLASLQSQTQNFVFAAPKASSGAPTFRALDFSDFPAIASNTVLGNITGSSAVPVALSKAQLTALVNTFTSSLSGSVPASGGGTTTFLRADGTFAAPAGGSSYTFIDSLANVSGSVSLVNDVSAPGNLYFYGTNSGGTRGWYLQSTLAATPTFSGLTQYGVMYAATTSTLASTPVGLTGQILAGASGGAPQWVSQFTLGGPSFFEDGGISFNSSTSGYVFIGAPAGAITSYNFLLPLTSGTTGQILTSSGGGVSAMTWTTLSTSNLSGSAQSTLTGSAGTAICSQPFQSSSYKKVVVYLNGYTDTATQTYTFPVAFSQTPYVYGLTAGVAGATVTASTIKFTVTTQTGFVILEGY